MLSSFHVPLLVFEQSHRRALMLVAGAAEAVSRELTSAKMCERIGSILLVYPMVIEHFHRRALVLVVEVAQVPITE